MDESLVQIAQLYSDVLDPLHALLFFIIGAGIYFAKPDTSRKTLAIRLGIVAAVYLVAGISSVTFYDSLSMPPEYLFDVIAATGALLGLSIIGGLWYLRGWGDEMITFTIFLLIVTFVFGVISPFWNFSGHVSLIAAPCVYLALIERRAVPLLLIPILMVPSRVLVNEHTLLQAVVALITVVFLGFLYVNYVEARVLEVL